MTSMASKTSKPETAFDLNIDSLKKMAIVNNGKQKQELLITQNNNTLQKFCDVCKRMNLDPLQEFALPLVVLLMSKSKHYYTIAEKYANIKQIEAPDSVFSFLEHVDMKSENAQKSCISSFNSMSDWIILFSYLKLKFDGALHTELEKNAVIQRMIFALSESQITSGSHANNVSGSNNVASAGMSKLEIALWALLYMSPCTTPAGKMLERFYTSINDNATDVELRCLRALSLFKDTMDDEDAYTKTLPLMMRCFQVNENFARGVDSVLRKSAQIEPTTNNVLTTRPCLQNYAKMAVKQKRDVVSEQSWYIWKTQISFSVTTSLHLQKMLYFIHAQTTPASVQKYAPLYDKAVLDRAAGTMIDNVDIRIILRVIDSLRYYENNIKHLIDFRAKCLTGLNLKTRQQLDLITILKLYIACYQHESIWEECWKHVIPTMNHTTITACKSFRHSFLFEIDEVLHNLIKCILDD